MVYSVELSQEEDDLLRNRANDAGKSPVDLIVDAIRHDNHRALLFDQRRKDLTANFQQLGVSDDALADELEAIKHQMRAERNDRAGQ